MESLLRYREMVAALVDLCVEMRECGDELAKSEILEVAARYAWALYHDLDFTYRTVFYGRETLKLREPLTPNDPTFFCSTAIIEELTDRASADLAALKLRSWARHVA